MISCACTPEVPFNLSKTTFAVCEAQKYVQEGYRWVVDVDLEKFFDRVNHDVLMGKLAKRIGDRRVLTITRRYLEAGVMAQGGVVIERYEGTPQDGPLSPLLANVLLDEVDKELEKRGHRFVRYADDCAPRRRGEETEYWSLNCSLAAREMRVGPSGSDCRIRAQTTASCSGLRAGVVSVAAKGGINPSGEAHEGERE